MLMSILLPALGRARSQGRLVKCLAHMRGLSQAAASFANDHMDRMQLATDEEGVKKADRARNIYAYDDNRELLAWPVALAQYAGIPYTRNGIILPPDDGGGGPPPPDPQGDDEPRYGWGIRAKTFEEAFLREDDIPLEFKLALCPADRVRVSTPFYPRHKGADNIGLKTGGANWRDDDTAEPNTAYWGFLSYGINEDLVGAEVEESNNKPACWRAIKVEEEWMGCKGEFNYPPTTPCGTNKSGWRLQGKLDRAFSPATVGMIFEAGPDNALQGYQGGSQDFANLIISAQSDGPYLADFQQRFGTRMPTRRHLGGQINVLFADMHGSTVYAVEFSEDNQFQRKLPAKYAEVNVRVSPYPPHQIDDGP